MGWFAIDKGRRRRFVGSRFNQSAPSPPPHAMVFMESAGDEGSPRQQVGGPVEGV
jgi:hypothetical protein